MAVLPALATGLDVNVRFRHALDFEFTAELAIFDLLDVTLCHAWVVDPDDAPTAEAVAGRSYNQLVERIVALDSPADAKASAKASENKGSDEEERRSPPSEKTPSPRRNSSEEELLRRAVEASLNVDGDEPVGDSSSDPPRSPPPRNFSPSPSTEKLLLSDFLERSASQLTPYGLANARASVKERELVVFFGFHPDDRKYPLACSIGKVLIKASSDPWAKTLIEHHGFLRQLDSYQIRICNSALLRSKHKIEELFNLQL